MEYLTEPLLWRRDAAIPLRSGSEVQQEGGYHTYRIVSAKKQENAGKQKTFPQKTWQRFSTPPIPLLASTNGDEMVPSIEAAKNLAKILDTTVGYLLRENEQADLFKDKRVQNIAALPE